MNTTDREAAFVAQTLAYAESPAHQRYLEIRGAGLLGQGGVSTAESLDEICRVGEEVLQTNVEPLAKALTQGI